MKLLRYYAIASLVCIFAALAVMWLVYRMVVMGGIAALAEYDNVATAQTILAPIRAALADYLVEAAALAGPSARPPLPPAVDEAINTLLRDAHVNRVKIYNRNGVVSASTSASLVGTNGADNPGFRSAINGRALGNLIRRDTFNRFDRAFEHANLFESYIPVRRRPSEPVLGVLEIYTDVNALLVAAERTQFVILGASGAILAMLYTALLFIVRRARNVIDTQQQVIRERTTTLEQLLRRSQRREERDRKKLAASLHEGLAQTLSAIKLALETGNDASARAGDRQLLLNSVVPGLREAIRQVRAMATDLHPPGLEDLGLVPTIRALCSQLEESYPTIDIEPQIALDVESIPAAMQIVVYRSIEGGVRLVAAQAATSLVRVALIARDGTLALTIEGNGTESFPRGLSDLVADTMSPLAALRERAMISGGDLSVSRSATGAMTLRSSWRL